MARLIDADVLKDAFEDDFHLTEYISDMIDDAPTIYAEPVRHGQWIEIRDKYNYLIGMKCSECGRRVRNCGENYCPKCGAKMDGGKENDCE